MTRYQGEQEDWRRSSIYLIFLIFLFLSPTLFFGYAGDDRFGVLNAEIFKQKQPALFQLIIDSFQLSGRFRPIGEILYAVTWKIFDYQNTWLYHALLALLTACSLLLFLNWLNRLARISNKDRTWMVLVVLAVTQFRLTYHDPIVSYNGLMQVLAILFFSSLIFLDAYIHKGKKQSLCLFAVALTLSILTYELLLFLLPIYVYLLLKQDVEARRRLHVAIVLIMVTISYLSFYTYGYFLHPSGYSGTMVRYDPTGILLAFIWQLTGSLPLSYGVSLATEWFGLSAWIGWGAYAIVAIASIVYAYLVRGQFGRNTEARIRVGVLGALIWICAAAATAATMKYQVELRPGVAYLQVFIQNFGFALIIYAIFNNQDRILKYGLTIVVVLTFLMNVLVLNEGKKHDGASSLAFRTVSNPAVMAAYSFGTLLMNRESFFNIPGDISPKIDIGKSVRWKVNDGFDSILNYGKNTGIIISESAWYNKGHLIIGEFNASDRSIENATVVASNVSRASHLVKIYGGHAVEKHNSTNGDLFSFSVSRPIPIPTGFVGTFR